MGSGQGETKHTPGLKTARQTGRSFVAPDVALSSDLPRTPSAKIPRSSSRVRAAFTQRRGSEPKDPSHPLQTKPAVGRLRGMRLLSDGPRCIA